MPKEKLVRYTTEELEAMQVKGGTETDWEHVRTMRDEDIVFDEDAPEVTPKMFAEAIAYRAKPVTSKQRVTLRLDADVLSWFKAQGKGYQTRINALLRAHMDAHRRSL